MRSTQDACMHVWYSALKRENRCHTCISFLDSRASAFHLTSVSDSMRSKFTPGNCSLASLTALRLSHGLTCAACSYVSQASRQLCTVQQPAAATICSNPLRSSVPLCKSIVLQNVAAKARAVACCVRCKNDHSAPLWSPYNLHER